MMWVMVIEEKGGRNDRAGQGRGKASITLTLKSVCVCVYTTLVQRKLTFKG